MNSRDSDPMLASPRPAPRIKQAKNPVRIKPPTGARYLDIVPPKGAPALPSPPQAPQVAAPLRPRRVKKPKPKTKRTSNWLYRWALPVMAVLLFIAGIFITIQTFRTNKAVQTQVTSGSTEEDPSDQDAAIPSEKKPTSAQISNYRVDPNAPRYLRISGIKVFARVYALGTDDSGKMRAPNNIYNVGWYDKSARPAQPGAVLLDGHSSANKGIAVFDKLDKLKPGSSIEIERGDGQKVNYRVVSVGTFLKDDLDMTKAVTSVQPGTNGLNIITCSGEYDEKTNTYDKRILVRAVQT